MLSSRKRESILSNEDINCFSNGVEVWNTLSDVNSKTANNFKKASAHVTEAKTASIALKSERLSLFTPPVFCHSWLL